MTGVQPIALGTDLYHAIAQGFASELRVFTVAFAAAYAGGHLAPPEAYPETSRLLVQLLSALAVPQVLAYRADQDGQPVSGLRFYPDRLEPADEMPLHRRLMELLPRRGFRGALTIPQAAYGQALPPLLELSARFCESTDEIWLRAGDRPLLLRLCHKGDVHVQVAGVRAFLPVTRQLKAAGAQVLFF